MDAVKNFAKCVVSGGYTSSSTVITLQAGEGSKLPQPSTDGEFNIVWWNYSDYPDPSADPDVEIVRCTVRTSDILTITRAQESTIATAKNISGKTYLMALSFTKKSYDEIKTYADRFLNAPQGFLLNGKIVPSVGSNNLTVALKTLAGTDPSASNPVHIRIGDTIRTITSALSVTANAGTNWCNAGSSELATREIDYFVYLGYNATNGVTIGFSRIPYANLYSDFSATTTNEKYCAISTITNAVAGDTYENVGRFAATLSAGAGHTWSVPTFTSTNLRQVPILETRWLDYAPVYTGFSSAPSAGRTIYCISQNKVFLQISPQNAGTSNAITFTVTTPFSSKDISGIFSHCFGRGQDNGSEIIAVSELLHNDSTISIYKNLYNGAFTNSGTKFARISLFYEI